MEKYYENPLAYLERSDRWRKNNREKYLEAAKQYAAANKEKRNETSRKWAAQNREAAISRARAWNEANREQKLKNEKARRLADPEKFRSVVRNRRAKLKVSGTHTAKDIASLWELQKGICNGCDCNLTESGYHVDHILAVAKGGSNGPENLQLLCPTCNTSKGTKDMREWLRIKKFVRVCP